MNLIFENLLFEAAATLRGLSSRVISGRIRKLRRDIFQFLTNENKLFENWREKIFMKFRKLASYPCGLMTGTPPWLLGRRGRNRLPKKLKMLQKTVDKCAKSTNIFCCLFPIFFVSVLLNFLIKRLTLLSGPGWGVGPAAGSYIGSTWVDFFCKSLKLTMDQPGGQKKFLRNTFVCKKIKNYNKLWIKSFNRYLLEIVSSTLYFTTLSLSSLIARFRIWHLIVPQQRLDDTNWRQWRRASFIAFGWSGPAVQ